MKQGKLDMEETFRGERAEQSSLHLGIAPEPSHQISSKYANMRVLKCRISPFKIRPQLMRLQPRPREL